ncbi:hypothetical protein CJ739_254 [Mariniflexile rhizosphaerae]|uniref:hypothetical protein n=1 Tax=unclassified Mariniflexile TaxID=2643887 RepID=UPI000E332434|nr:hypothetical protein [Mariniflexile sp. TRM1-10]AXP79354.1 hypothetical protein CJ739_254 [Mariniflexile sp. TRM1-10]
MNTKITQKSDSYRRLSIQKDLNELSLWILTLEDFNDELDCFNVFENQLIHNIDIANSIKALRRRNVLTMATFCKYNQELINECKYGQNEYNLVRAKVHENKRIQFWELKKEYDTFKRHVYKVLMRFKFK